MGVDVSSGGAIVQLSVKRELEFVPGGGGVADVRGIGNSSDIHFTAEDSEAHVGPVTCPGPRHQRQEPEPGFPSPQSSVYSFFELQK